MRGAAKLRLARRDGEVRELKPVVEAITARTFEVDEHVQDASFFTELASFVDARQSPSGGIVRHVVLAIRFSAFGRMFTIWHSRPEEFAVDSALVQRVISAVQNAGYTYADAAELQSPYDGPNRHLAGVSWWERYFDYL